MILGSHFRLTLYVLSCFSLVAIHLTGAAPTTEPSITVEQYPQHHFQKPQIFFPASGSHTSITILDVQPNDAEVQKATPKRLYTRRITLLLCIHVDPSGILCYGTTIRAFSQKEWSKAKLEEFFRLVSLSKKKRRNFIHLDVLFKLICMKNKTNCITGIIRFLFFIFMWFDFNLTTFLHSCVLPIHVNQTPRLIEILCFQILCFAHAFLSYSYVFPVPAFIESSNSKELLQIYFIFRQASKKTLCVMSCSCRAVIHPT